MVHYFVMMEGQRKYQEEFVSWLTSRQHVTQLPNMPGLAVQPNIREVRLYDISVFESCIGQLLQDLAPFNSGDDGLKGWLKKLSGVGRKMFGLQDPPGSVSKRQAPAHPIWRDHINVFILAKKDDKWIHSSEMV